MKISWEYSRILGYVWVEGNIVYNYYYHTTNNSQSDYRFAEENKLLSQLARILQEETSSEEVTSIRLQHLVFVFIPVALDVIDLYVTQSTVRCSSYSYEEIKFLIS